MLDRIIRLVTSLRLTVLSLVAALILVFAGTLAQVKLGLYATQEQYFRSLFVFWKPPGLDFKIPIWPGGYLLGAILLVNLTAVHFKRFKFTWKKSGIILTHLGLILLLLGQFLTEVFQVESFLRIEEGSSKNFSEDARRNELAIIDVSSPDRDQVVAVPESLLVPQKEIALPQFPLTLRVKEYLPNSTPGGPMVKGAGKRITATQGVGQRLPFDQAPATTRMNDEDKPAALVEVLTPKGSLGEWTVSTWLSKHPWSQALREQLGAQMGSALNSPQQFSHEGRTYQLALRPVRHYKPFSIQLLDFNHARYKGTDIPKDFSSRIRLTNSHTGEDREVLIYMNNPLRYGGETFYQGGFEPGDTVSILQVVRNPAWLTPYFSCALVGVGLLVQFLIHLVGFLNKPATRREDSAPAAGSRALASKQLGTAAAASAVPASSRQIAPTSTQRRNS